MNLAPKRKLGRTFARIGALAALACLAGSGAAEAACPSAPVSQPFTQFGDTSYYELAPGGGFETGMDAWTRSGAAVAAGNETFFVRSATDVSALRIQAKGVATSPPLCVDARYPTLRLFAKKVSGSQGQLKVEMLYPDSGGNTKVAQAGTLSNGRTADYTKWRPTPVLKLGTGLPLSTSSTGTMTVRLRLTADKAGEWAVDDVYTDPYRS